MISNLKSQWGWVILGGLVILAIFIALRLFNLTILPVFVDEAIYIRWSQVMKAEPTLRFLPLSDGKQPLFMWLTIPFFKFFSDPLMAGRMVSVMSGLGTLLGLFLLSWKLFKSKKIALLTVLFYAIIPFVVFFNRMALADSLLAMFGVWILYLGVLLAEKQRLDLAIILGMVLGGAFLTKSPAIFFALLLPTTILFLPFKKRKELPLQLIAKRSFDISELRSVIKLVGLWLVVYFFAYAIYNSLRLGPNFHMIALRNKDYVFPISHFFTNPLDPFKFHLVEIWQWFGTLLTWPIFLLGIVGILWSLRKNLKLVLLLVTWVFFPLLVQAEFAKVFTARYLLFPVPFFLIFSALGLSYINTLIYDKLAGWKRIGQITLLIIILIPALYFNFLLLTNPQKAPLPRREREGYLELWTAGFGLREVASYIVQESKSGQHIIVGTEGAFGTLPDGLQIYLNQVPGVTVIGTGQISFHQVPDSLKNAAKENKTYLVVNDSRMYVENDSSLVLVKKFPKVQQLNGKTENLLFYQVLAK